MYQIKRNLRGAFPNVEVLLRKYLTLMISNCSREMYFYKLELTKDEH